MNLSFTLAVGVATAVGIAGVVLLDRTLRPGPQRWGRIFLGGSLTGGGAALASGLMTKIALAFWIPLCLSYLTCAFVVIRGAIRERRPT